MIEQTRFLSTVSLCSEFKLENIIIYSGVNFCGKNVCGKFARPYFGRLLEKSQNLAKILCHMVSLSNLVIKVLFPVVSTNFAN